MIQIAIINESTVLTDAQVHAAVPALQTQISRDFAPAWGRDATLVSIPRGFPIPPGYWQLVVLDDSDAANALGYHDTTADFMPLSKVFAKSDLAAGSKWTMTASHELLEMLADPDISLASVHGNLVYAYECADPCEDEAYAYQIDGVAVSDFVFPSWFEIAAGHPVAGQQYDFQNNITAPLQLLPGGYISVLDMGTNQGWQQLFGKNGPSPAARAHVGSRRERRAIPRWHWIPSSNKQQK